jgi:hypothetical protein
MAQHEIISSPYELPSWNIFATKANIKSRGVPMP